MWILDSCYRGRIELWVREQGTVRQVTVPYAPFFYLCLPDRPQHRELIGALEERYTVEACTFSTIHGSREGYRVFASRTIAEAIERQCGFAAELFNVDTRADQRYMAEQDIFPCGNPGEDRLAPDFPLDLSCLRVEVEGDPHHDTAIPCITCTGTGTEIFAGREEQVLESLGAAVVAQDPDVILLPDAGLWMPRILERARRCGITLPFSRTGKYRTLSSRSYWSYGRVEYKAGACIPDGRVLIDTARSFTYREGDLSGVILAARLAGICPNLAAHFTPGTLISGYEVYEALRRGIAVPFRKNDPERVRRFCDLRALDRGGMMFQPRPGVYADVAEIDFTSLYPALIVKHNLSPETLDAPTKAGFLAGVLAPLLSLRVETKRRKKTAPSYAHLDGILKWMLVTCFGYTGYRNAKFGQIEVHEQITAQARETLLAAKECAESCGCHLIHGIVDCLWLQGGDPHTAKRRIEQQSGLLTEYESYDWIVFLPLADGYGAYNRYYGRKTDGELKIRGIMARRGDTPAYVRATQEALLGVLCRARTLRDLAALEEQAYTVYQERLQGLLHVTGADLAITRQVSRVVYEKNCLEAAAVRMYRDRGIAIEAGMEVGYVVRDAGKWLVDPVGEAAEYDLRYYRALLDKAWEEVRYAFGSLRAGGGGVGSAGGSARENPRLRQ
jgi:DNA polymerase I